MPTEIGGETYLNTSEAIGRLGISRPTLDKLVKDGRLTRYRQGVKRTAYFKEFEINRLLEIREDTGDEE